MNRELILRRRIKWLTWFFIIGLVVSGATAIPLLPEVNWLASHFSADKNFSMLAEWLFRVRDALVQTQSQYPFLFYGTDWLEIGRAHV